MGKVFLACLRFHANGEKSVAKTFGWLGVLKSSFGPDRFVCVFWLCQTQEQLIKHLAFFAL